MKRILMVSHDVTLNELRSALLETCYETVSAEPAEAIPALRRSPFDLLLVCHTVTGEEASAIIEAAHAESHRVRIVHLRDVAQQPMPNKIVDRLVTINHHPDGWLRAVDDLLAPVAAA